jgi:hypothetical protein
MNKNLKQELTDLVESYHKESNIIFALGLTLGVVATMLIAIAVIIVNI